MNYDFSNINSCSKWMTPGNAIKVKGNRGFWHHGILTERFVDGNPTVISASAEYGKVIEQTMKDFQNGKMIFPSEFQPLLPNNIAILRARSLLGKPYSIFDNCEHFTTEVLGYKKHSPQLQNTVSWAVFTLGLFAVAKSG